jgi:predicted nucleotidyltransferase
MELIEKFRKTVEEICSKFKVEELYVFGSILSTKFNSKSDIDFIVSIESEDPIEYAENYFEVKAGLETIFHRKIDLLEQKAISNKTFKAIIDKTKMLVYAKRNQSVA